MIHGSNLERRRRKSLKRLAAKFGVSLGSVHEMPLLTIQPLHRNSLTLTAYWNSLLQSVRDGGVAATTSGSSGDEPSLHLTFWHRSFKFKF
jgi:hypothetical protein